MKVEWFKVDKSGDKLGWVVDNFILLTFLLLNLCL
jgi:hypothetical protein